MCQVVEVDVARTQRLDELRGRIAHELLESLVLKEDCFGVVEQALKVAQHVEVAQTDFALRDVVWQREVPHFASNFVVRGRLGLATRGDEARARLLVEGVILVRVPRRECAGHLGHGTEESVDKARDAHLAARDGEARVKDVAPHAPVCSRRGPKVLAKDALLKVDEADDVVAVVVARVGKVQQTGDCGVGGVDGLSRVAVGRVGHGRRAREVVSASARGRGGASLWSALGHIL